MASSPPEILVRGGGDRGLAWATLFSAVVHLAALAVAILAPQSFLRAARPLESYTVDLVSPNVVGGTNLIPGSGGKPRPATAPKPVEHPAPSGALPDKLLEPKAPEVPEAAEQQQAALPPPVPKPPEPAPAAAPKPPPAPKPPEARPPAAKPAVPVPGVKPEPPRATAAKPAEKPQSAAPDKPAAKPVEPRPERPAAPVAKPAGNAAAQSAAGQNDPAAEEARKRDQAILAAIERRRLSIGASGAAGVGGDAGRGTGGGPLSVGPGEGAGGTVKGFAYLLYYNQLKARIRGSWAWVGAATSLEAVVEFNINENGEVMNVRTLRSSGDPSYDASVERAIRAGSPFGPPPDEYRDEFLKGIEVSFRVEELRS